MADTINRTPQFRAALRRELALWVEQGLLDEHASRRIAGTYALDRLGKESSKLLTAVLFTIGGLLLGGGIISFVAANWQGVPALLKAGMSLAAMIGFYVVGYWAGERRGTPRLGQALMFCGCLAFGANIGLFAQIFQISGSWSNGFLAWGLGSAVMAWAAGSELIGMLALAVSFVWFGSFASERHATATFYPFAIALVFLPLTWRLHARSLYLSTLGCLIAAPAVLVSTGGANVHFTVLALAIGGIMVWDWVNGIGHRTFGRNSGIRRRASVSPRSHSWPTWVLSTSGGKTRTLRAAPACGG